MIPGENKGPQRAPNALVPTRIAYVGGEMSFQVDMSSEVRPSTATLAS